MAARDYYDTAHSSVGCPTMVCFCFAWAWESVVFAYRIFKEPQLLKVWAQKNENWKEFSQKFRRDEFPEEMPFRSEIRKELDLLNDYWAYPNILRRGHLSRNVYILVGTKSDTKNRILKEFETLDSFTT